METIDWAIIAGFLAVATVALNPLAFLPYKRKRMEDCRCFYCR